MRAGKQIAMDDEMVALAIPNKISPEIKTNK